MHLDMAPYEAEGGAKRKAPKAAKAAKPKRPLSAYNKFVKKCSQTPEGKTRSGKDMMRYCASKWRAMSEAEKAKYK